MLEPGSLVDGRFEVEAMVGEGGMAQVYRVRHRELGRVMALKLLTWRKKSLVERLVLEGRIQAQLAHPNIVAVVDLVRHDGQVGLLMEYIDDAVSLDDYLEQHGAMACDEALELFTPVLAAVAAAHAGGVTHRDLKPANVMLARVGSAVVPKVTDFGIAKVVTETAGSSTRSGATMGTPGYLAPEQVKDASTIDARADVFALGAMVYEVLTGRQAFADEDGLITVASTLQVEPVPLGSRAEVPASVAEAVHRAMAKEPEDRFESCEAFAAALLAHRPELLAGVSSEGRTRPLSLSGQSTTGAGTEPPRTSPTDAGTFQLEGGTVDTLAPPVVLAPAQPERSSRLLWLGAAGAMALVVTVALIAGGGGALVAALALQQGSEGTQAVAPVDPPTPPPVGPPAAPLPAPVAPQAAPEPAGGEVPAPTPVAPPKVVPPPPPVPVPVAAEPEPEPEPEVVPEPEPAPQPEVVPEPVPEPEPEPEAAPAAVSYPPVAGSWAGTAGKQRIGFELDDDGAGGVSGSFSLSAGANTRKENVSGTVTPAGAVRLSGGGLVFEGTVAGDTLGGQYMSTRSGNNKWIEWAVQR